MSAATTIVIVVVGILILALVGGGLGWYFWWKKSHSSGGGGPFFPLNPYDGKALPLKRLANLLPIVPLHGQGGACMSLNTDAHCPPVNQAPVQNVQTPITQPAEWLLDYVLNFPLWGTASDSSSPGCMLYFLPWKPVDVVGNDPQDDSMWLMMLVDGSNQKDNTYRFPILFDGLNPSITNDQQAVQEYGLGWKAATGGCVYAAAPWNSEIDDLSKFSKDVVISALKAVLGPQNPAFKGTNGWIVVGYTDMVYYDNGQNSLCNYSCSVPGLNNGSGVFYFDQVRLALGLPASSTNLVASGGCRCVCSHGKCTDSCNGKHCVPVG